MNHDALLRVTVRIKFNNVCLGSSRGFGTQQKLNIFYRFSFHFLFCNNDRVIEIDQKKKCTATSHMYFTQPPPMLTTCITIVQYQNQKVTFGKSTGLMCVCVCACTFICIECNSLQLIIYLTSRNYHHYHYKAHS